MKESAAVVSVIVSVLALLLCGGCTPANPPPQPYPAYPPPPPPAESDESGTWQSSPGPDVAQPGPSDAPESRHQAESPVDPYPADPPTRGPDSSRPTTRPPAPAPPPEAGPTGRLAGILAAHNRHRADHCAPPLTWSKELAASARRWANILRDNQCAFEHDPNTKLGENLAFFSPSGSAGAADVVAGWYNEVSSYDFANPGFNFQTGHFTQIVWIRSSELGCAVAQCANADLWVCRYNPAGNWRGQYRNNVKPESCKGR